MKHTAASWWYVKVQCNQVPDTWEEFEIALRTEFIPQDRLRRARDKLRKLTQRTAVSAYLTEVQNIVLSIPGITENEKLDRFCSGLKPQVKLEVVKSNPTSFDQAAQVALSVDSAFFGAGMFNSWGGQSRNFSTPTYQPMEIGNIEKRQQHYGGNGFRNNNLSEQRKRGLQNNACFTCHKPGYRPWKHQNVSKISTAKKFIRNNAQVATDSDSGNE